MKNFWREVFVVFGLLLIPASVWAHKPTIVSGETFTVTDPEISRAFYAELKGAPQKYEILSSQPFNLYVNVLVPKSSNASGRYSFTVKNFDTGKQLVQMDGTKSDWTEFHEEFAGDDYLKGSEYKLEKAPAGKYEVVVTSPNMSGKYVLAVGEKEAFGPRDVLGVFTTLPQLKRNFFEVSPLTLFAAWLGIVLGLGILAALAILLLAWHVALKLARGANAPKLKARLKNNIGRPDRLARLALGLALVILAVHWWSWLIFIAASFLVYEAAAGWCGLFAVMGRNTCRVG